MAENYDVNCRVMDAKFAENGFEKVIKERQEERKHLAEKKQSDTYRHNQ